MAKSIKILEVAVTGTPSANSPFSFSLPKKTVAVSVTNMLNSANEMSIGWDETPSSKNYLTQGDSRPYGPLRDGDYLDQANKTIRCAFMNVSGGALNPGNNQGLLIILFEDDNEYCE